MKKEFNILDGTLTQLELMQEKARIVCSDMVEDYFSLQNLEMIKCYHESASIKNSIILDYLYNMKNKIQELRNLME